MGKKRARQEVVDSGYLFVERLNAKGNVEKAKARKGRLPHNRHSGRLSSYGCCVILWTSGNYINDGLSKEELKRGGVP